MLASFNNQVNWDASTRFMSQLCMLNAAAQYANIQLRFAPHELFDEYDKDFLENQPKTRELGKRLAEIAARYDLCSQEGCKSAETDIPSLLHLPSDIYSIY